MLEIRLQQNVLLFSGELNRDTVAVHGPFHLLNQCKGAVLFDLAEVSHVDTAGLAWLLQVLAMARAAGLQPTLQEVPVQLRKLAVVSDVLNLLPMVER